LQGESKLQIALIVLGVLNFILIIVLLVIAKQKVSNGEQGQESFFKTLVEYQDRQKHFQSLEFQNLKDIVNRSLGDGLDRSQRTMQQVMERLVKVDETQKSLNSLGENVNQLQNVLTDKKSRGIFGEVQLKQLLTSVFGEAQGSYYELQKSLSNQKIVDAIMHLPEPLGSLAIDSKFPLENYKRMVDEDSSSIQREQYAKDFSNNLKKHIDDISSKYIIPGETADQAILFLPAEAIFAQVHAYHSDIINYAFKKKVWITSPTTLMATISTIQVILRNIERTNNMSKIHEEINKLGDEFERHEGRWDDLSRHLLTVQKDIEKLNTTHRKMGDRFTKIVNLTDEQ
jgi:DNA recombination protein RmuC